MSSTSHEAWSLLAAVNAASREEERLRLLVSGLPSVLPCELCGVALRLGTGWKAVLRDRSGRCHEAEPERVASLGELFEAASLEARIVRLGRPSSGVDPPVLDAWGVGMIAAVPLMTLDERMGVLFVGCRGQEDLAGEAVALLQQIAEQVAIGLQNLRLLRRLEEQAGELERLVEERTLRLRGSERRLRSLLDITNALVTHLERDSLLRSIADALRGVLPLDRASLLLKDPARGDFTVFALVHDKPASLLPRGARVRAEELSLLEVLQTKRPRLVPDLERESVEGIERQLLREGIRSMIVAPLLVRGEPIGTLNVGSRTPGLYTEADASFLGEVAGQIALAVENMRAYEEVQRLRARLERENVALQEEVRAEWAHEEIVGRSPSIQAVLEAARTVAPTDAIVLITGETGTGKSVLARLLHRWSRRSERPLVTVNCAALPPSLVESELFGHEKGAFTGALRRKIGRFELAHEATLFLDEVGEIPLEIQAKLLRVLQDGELERIGSSETIRVDVRLIAATNRDLDREVREGRFRADLFYRLNVFPIRMPSLRERKEDLPLLIRHLVMIACARAGRPMLRVPPEIERKLSEYDWPGNVRELQNVIERGVILSRGDTLVLGPWPPSAPSAAAGEPLTLDELQRRHIVSVLERTGGKVSGRGGAAEILGLKPTTLQARMKKLGIRRPTR